MHTRDFVMVGWRARYKRRRSEGTVFLGALNIVWNLRQYHLNRQAANFQIHITRILTYCVTLFAGIFDHLALGKGTTSQPSVALLT